jgi:esterase/lipase
MLKNRVKIEGIPAILWGEECQRVIIAVHGNMSNKEDIPIEMLARHAADNGYQVLSFDLPEHGERKSENTPCQVQYCVKDLATIMEYTKSHWNHISLFANSMGAYFSLLAFKDESLEKAWFLSPVVDMQRIIENMMMWFDVSEERLQQEKTIDTPMGHTLYWDYYCYVKDHPVDVWDIPTYILSGSKDNLCETDTITKFVQEFSCKLKIVQEAEHYFQTQEQLEMLEEWIKDNI